MKSILITTLFSLFSISSFAQHAVKTYTGESNTPNDIYLLGGFTPSNVPKGEISYSYYESEEGRRTKHGKFQFNYTYNSKYTISGTYQNGNKEGIWTMTKFNPYSGKELDKITITYKNDFLDGPFNGIVYDVNTSIICSGKMKNNHYIGEIKIETPKSQGVLNAFFNESGWAHGRWTIERKAGIPIKQEQEYFEGFLLKVTELDLSSGEKSVLFELPEVTIEEIKNTFNGDMGTLIISGVEYKRIQDRHTTSGIDSRLFPSVSGGKTVPAIFYGIYSPTLKHLIPMKNGFADMEKN